VPLDQLVRRLAVHARVNERQHDGL
jgi:hypothetical protein